MDAVKEDEMQMFCEDCGFSFSSHDAAGCGANLTLAEADAIIAREFSGADFGTREPVITSGICGLPEIGDGLHWEVADLSSEAALAAQCRAWIEACK